MPPPPAPHGTTNRWRTGCRCKPCEKAHTADVTGWRRDVADRAFPPHKRARLLELLAAGNNTACAAAALNLTVQAVYFRRRWDEQWGRQLDEALMAGRDPQVPHGTAAGRKRRCACPECRAVHSGSSDAQAIRLAS